MALFLLLEPLLQRLHQFIPTAHFLDLRHFFGREIFFGNGLQPICGNVDGVLAIFGKDAFEDLTEDLVEAVKQGFIFYQRRAREIIKLFRALADYVCVQRGEQGQMLL